MKNLAQIEAKPARKLVFHRVAENLYRLGTSGGYYGLVKRGDKQFRRSLRTRDRKLAERRLAEFRLQVGNLKMATEDRSVTFPELAERWMAATSHAVKPSTLRRRKSIIGNLTPFFAGLAVRSIQPQHCERWLTERGQKIAAQTMANELHVMRPVFEFAVRLGLLLQNPARDIKRRKMVQRRIIVPTREQFKKLVAEIRENDGRIDSQEKARIGADLIELLAYSGCRLGEATALLWSDADFETGTLTIRGGVDGTKNYEPRVIPMTEALRVLLLRLKDERKPALSDPISPTHRAKTCLNSASRRLGYPHFTHHDFRHFFATTCIESGVDIPTVSRWLGHKDGGALAMRVYGHLRQEHNFTAVKRVTF